MIGKVFSRLFCRQSQSKPIQQKADYKTIKESAYTAVNLLRGNKDSELANAAYGRFLAEGKKAPGYASTILRTARNDAHAKDTTRYVRYKLSDSEYSRRGEQMRVGLSLVSKRNAKAQAEFDEAGKKMYPHTWDARNRILSWYQDTTGHRQPTSYFKDYKRDVLQALKEHRQNSKRIPVTPQMQELIDHTIETHHKEEAMLEESLRKYGLD